MSHSEDPGPFLVGSEADEPPRRRTEPDEGPTVTHLPDEHDTTRGSDEAAQPTPRRSARTCRTRKEDASGKADKESQDRGNDAARGRKPPSPTDCQHPRAPVGLPSIPTDQLMGAEERAIMSAEARHRETPPLPMTRPS